MTYAENTTVSVAKRCASAGETTRDEITNVARDVEIAREDLRQKILDLLEAKLPEPPPTND